METIQSNFESKTVIAQMVAEILAPLHDMKSAEDR